MEFPPRLLYPQFFFIARYIGNNYFISGERKMAFKMKKQNKNTTLNN
jgi:hypothetical protein